MEYAKDRDNVLYLFGLGYVNVYHCDVGVGIKQLNKFIEQAKGKDEYKDLVSNVVALVSNREKKMAAKTVMEK